MINTIIMSESFSLSVFNALDICVSTVLMEIFHLSKKFPLEEKYSLTDQIRRSSRSVCVNIAEGYRKRIYPKHFTSKMTDADAEASETCVWLDFAKDCNYIDEK